MHLYLVFALVLGTSGKREYGSGLQLSTEFVGTEMGNDYHSDRSAVDHETSASPCSEHACVGSDEVFQLIVTESEQGKVESVGKGVLASPQPPVAAQSNQ